MPLTFGYGSNMCYGRMKYRVRSLKFEGMGVLDGYQFVINKVSKDASAKGNIETASGQRVFGVVFSLAADDIVALDAAEGVSEGYVVNEGLDVRTRDGEPWGQPVRVYIADSRYVAKDLWPYAWYKRHIVEGALHYGLPHEYVRWLQLHPAADDPDRMREIYQRMFPCGRELTAQEGAALEALKRAGGNLTDYALRIRRLRETDPDRFADGLRALLQVAAQVAAGLSSPATWTPEAGSSGQVELDNSESGPQGPWGQRPVRTAYAVAAMAVQAVIEYARASEALVALPQSPLVPEILARGSLEAAASAWWLLEPGLGARRRVCRLQLVRIKSAMELERASQEIGVSNAEGIYGETVDQVRSQSDRLGLGPFIDHGRDPAAICETETRPRYTERVTTLLDDWKFQGAYNLYSGTAHAELYAVWRLFKQIGPSVPEQEPVLRLVPDPKGLHLAIHAVLLAMIAPLERASLLFGWNADSGPGAELSTIIDHVNSEMARLKPTT